MEIRRVASVTLGAVALFLLGARSAVAESDWAAIAKQCAENYPGNQARQISCMTAARDDARSHQRDDAQPAAPTLLRRAGEPCRSHDATDCGKTSSGTTAH
jgi:hypothetical protein